MGVYVCVSVPISKEKCFPAPLKQTHTLCSHMTERISPFTGPVTTVTSLLTVSECVWASQSVCVPWLMTSQSATKVSLKLRSHVCVWGPRRTTHKKHICLTHTHTNILSDWRWPFMCSEKQNSRKTSVMKMVVVTMEATEVRSMTDFECQNDQTNIWDAQMT